MADFEGSVFIIDRIAKGEIGGRASLTNYELADAAYRGDRIGVMVGPARLQELSGPDWLLERENLLGANVLQATLTVNEGLVHTLEIAVVPLILEGFLARLEATEHPDQLTFVPDAQMTQALGSRALNFSPRASKS